MIIAVGTKNPAKLKPVKKIFSKYFKDVKVVSIDVNPGISEQPMSEDEMYKGALNRAKEALSKVEKAEYGVGIEAGLHKYSYGWLERALVVIININGDIGIGATGGLVLPDRIVKRIHKGESLGKIIDSMFTAEKSGEGIGMFGIFTKNVVTRAKSIEHGVVFALTRFLHKKLY